MLPSTSQNVYTFPCLPSLGHMDQQGSKQYDTVQTFAAPSIQLSVDTRRHSLYVKHDFNEIICGLIPKIEMSSYL